MCAKLSTTEFVAQRPDEITTMRKTLAPSLNWFLVDVEISVREMVELGVANWMAVQCSGADEHGGGELTQLASQLLEDAVKMEKCWTTAGRCAATSADVLGQDDATGQ